MNKLIKCAICRGAHAPKKVPVAKAICLQTKIHGSYNRNLSKHISKAHPNTFTKDAIIKFYHKDAVFCILCILSSLTDLLLFRHYIKDESKKHKCMEGFQQVFRWHSTGDQQASRGHSASDQQATGIEMKIVSKGG